MTDPLLRVHLTPPNLHGTWKPWQYGNLCYRHNFPAIKYHKLGLELIKNNLLILNEQSSRAFNSQLR